MQIHDWSVAHVRRAVSAHRDSGDIWRRINGAVYSHLWPSASYEACFTTEKGAVVQAGLVDNQMDAKKPTANSTGASPVRRHNMCLAVVFWYPPRAGW